MAPLPVEPQDGEHLSWFVGVITALGGLFVGFKRIRAEVAEVARGEARLVVIDAIEEHVKEKHDPLTEKLTDIQVGIARIEAHLAERQVALTERIAATEVRCKDNLARGFCDGREPGGGE